MESIVWIMMAGTTGCWAEIDSIKSLQIDIDIACGLLTSTQSQVFNHRCARWKAKCVDVTDHRQVR